MYEDVWSIQAEWRQEAQKTSNHCLLFPSIRQWFHKAKIGQATNCTFTTWRSKENIAQSKRRFASFIPHIRLSVPDQQLQSRFEVVIEVVVVVPHWEAATSLQQTAQVSVGMPSEPDIDEKLTELRPGTVLRLYYILRFFSTHLFDVFHPISGFVNVSRSFVSISHRDLLKSSFEPPGAARRPSCPSSCTLKHVVVFMVVNIRCVSHMCGINMSI